MVVNVHLQLRSGTAAQEATVVFQLHVLEEPVIHVLSCHWKNNKDKNKDKDGKNKKLKQKQNQNQI